MTYIVISRRVGTPGDVYTPTSEAQAQRLLRGGFIAVAKQVSPKQPGKARKVKLDPEETNNHGS